jgi:hypothetical protein
MTKQHRFFYDYVMRLKIDFESLVFAATLNRTLSLIALEMNLMGQQMLYQQRLSHIKIHRPFSFNYSFFQS